MTDETTNVTNGNGVEQQGKKSNTTLIVVIILVVLFIPMILGVFLCGGAALIGIAVPKYSDVSESAKMNACRANMRTLASQEVIYFAEHDCYTESLAELGMSGIVCSECSQSYRITVRGDDLTIECPCGHGSIENGRASWSN